jgi:hypothetical protein
MLVAEAPFAGGLELPVGVPDPGVMLVVDPPRLDTVAVGGWCLLPASVWEPGVCEPLVWPGG